MGLSLLAQDSLRTSVPTVSAKAAGWNKPPGQGSRLASEGEGRLLASDSCVPCPTLRCPRGHSWAGAWGRKGAWLSLSRLHVLPRPNQRRLLPEPLKCESERWVSGALQLQQESYSPTPAKVCLAACMEVGSRKQLLPPPPPMTP